MRKGNSGTPADRLVLVFLCNFDALAEETGLAQWDANEKGIIVLEDAGEELVSNESLEFYEDVEPDPSGSLGVFVLFAEDEDDTCHD